MAGDDQKPAEFGQGYQPGRVAVSHSTIDQAKWERRAEEHRQEMAKLESPIRRLQVGLPVAKFFLSPLLAAGKLHPATATIAAYLESGMADLEEKVKALGTAPGG